MSMILKLMPLDDLHDGLVSVIDLHRLHGSRCSRCELILDLLFLLLSGQTSQKIHVTLALPPAQVGRDWPRIPATSDGTRGAEAVCHPDDLMLSVMVYLWKNGILGLERCQWRATRQLWRNCVDA